MKSAEIRKLFLDFFKSKNHYLAEPAPLVMKNDPTLMFTNAGMNQFKEIFLGNQPVKYSRIADTQPCLRVSGKHNDLEDVGHDTYHHTLFEMLGNWSFGDYFKKEAIEWAWQLLTEVYKLNKQDLYVTYFGGDKADKLEADEEAKQLWLQFVDEDKIIACSKKDNFWEMGDTGPCGPCSEIHIDLRSDKDKATIPGKDLVNQDHPQVVEIWNLVFIQFNRTHQGLLESLPNAHVDTGMGFERLTMALQGKRSNYDTDIFQPIIHAIAQMCNKTYGESKTVDVAMRVIADHIRAITFIIADGQLPSNTKAGYVCRRILRRAVRYGYTYLGFDQPFMFALVKVLVSQMSEIFPQLEKQQTLVMRVIKEEEQAFLRTLANGLRRLDAVQADLITQKNTVIAGDIAFELYDTYGFPFDLTALIAREAGYTVDEAGFKTAMQAQKERSRQDAATDTHDWITLKSEDEIAFVGYDLLEIETEIQKFRKVTKKGQDFYQVVLSPTPFFAESGGQVGDKGWLQTADETIEVLDTQKENSLLIHTVQKLPKDINESLLAKVDSGRRQATAANHSATHLLHAALRQILGTHVEQKGSLVTPDYLRFDFSHFSKLTTEELELVEKYVIDRIFKAIPKEEVRQMPINEAKEKGAMALFGEKYGDFVRVITFDAQESVELCGGTHVSNTSEIGLFKILSEGSVSSGVRRIEAITGKTAFSWLNKAANELAIVRQMLNNPKEVITATEKMLTHQAMLSKRIEYFENQELNLLINKLKEEYAGGSVVAEVVQVSNPDALKKICFELRKNTQISAILLMCTISDKAYMAISFSDDLVAKGASAAAEIKTFSKLIAGGGGGQAHLATSGGNNSSNFAAIKSSFFQKFNS